MVAHIDEIAGLAHEATASAAAQPGAMKARLEQQVRELLGDATLAPERLAQEAALLAVRADVREEIDRLEAHVEQARSELGEDWWPYGVQENRAVLATFLRYHHEQGLSRQRLEPDKLFAPETLEAFKI